MTYDEAQKALQRAEWIIEKNYAFTGEVKLLPLALQQLQKATTHAWKYKGGNKPKLLEELENILNKRKESSVEFKRKEKLIICTKDYKTTIIEEKIVKNYLQKTRIYLKKCMTKNPHEKN